MFFKLSDCQKGRRGVQERKIVSDIKRYLKTVEGCFFWKEHGGMYGTAGIPDIIICYKGHFIGLEAKTDTGKPTDLQTATIWKIRRAGGTAEIVRSVEDVKNVIARFQ